MMHAMRLPSVDLRRLAPAAAALFVAAFFALAARGAAPSAGVYAVILAGSALFAVAVLAASALFAALETLTGRAWALGFRRLEGAESGPRGLAMRAFRYATFLWAANGAALSRAARIPAHRRGRART